MARCLIVGCGCRGGLLARGLVAHGHAVRGTSRDPSRREGIEATGAEAVLADPQRVATLAPAFEHVSVACVLLGSAIAGREELAALHAARLDTLLHQMLDTTVRGMVYEARGAVDPAILDAGAERVRKFCEGSRIPYVLLGADPGDYQGWLEAALGAVERVLGPSA